VNIRQTHRGACYSFRQMHDGPSSPIGVEAATTVLSSVRARDRPDPDAAAVACQVPGRRVQAAITGYQRSWYWHHPAVAVGLALWARQAQPADGDEAALAVAVDMGARGGYEVGGIVAYRDSILPSVPATSADSTMARRSDVRNTGNGGEEAARERLASSRPLSGQPLPS